MVVIGGDLNLLNTFKMGQQKIVQMVKSGVLPIEKAIEANQQLIKNHYLANKAINFKDYSRLLLPLDIQAIELCSRNHKMPPEIRVPDSWFDNLPTSDDPQSINRLKVYYVVKGTVNETLAYNWELLRLAPLATSHAGLFRDSIEIQLDESAHIYSEGVHLIEIDLVANWFPETGIIVEQVRKDAINNGVKLAGLEAVAAYAMHTDLLQLQDGINLPFCALIGINGTLGFRWHDSSQQACIGWWPSCGTALMNYAVPVVSREY